MATGDYLVRRNNANTSIIPDAGSDLVTVWDTEVTSRGSSITYAAGGTFTLGELGNYLVLASEYINTSDTTTNQRNNAKMTFNLGGTELQEGYSTGYIRRSGGSQGCILQSMAIIEVTSLTGGANELRMRVERVDSSTAGNVFRVANDRSGITILKLDDNLNYGRYSGTVSSGASSVVCTLDTTIEEDGVVFSRTGNNIATTTTNRVLVLTSFKIDETNTDITRSEYSSFVRDAGNGNATVENTRIQTMKRGDSSQGCNLGGACIGTVFEPALGADLQMIMFTHTGATGINMDVDIMLVELPADCKAAKLDFIGTSGSNFNTVNTDFSFATTRFIDTDTFTATTPGTDITVDVDGPFLAFANFADRDGSTATRAVPSARFAVNDTVINSAGCSTYNRNSGGVGNGQMALGSLLELTTNDNVSVNCDRIGTNTGAVDGDGANFVLIEVDSFAPPPPGDHSITGDVTINVIPASTMSATIATAPGDYTIYRNASDNSSLIPDAGASLDLLWDTLVDRKGGAPTYIEATGEFKFHNTGRYLVMFSDFFTTSLGQGSSQTRCWAQEIYIGGTRQLAGATSSNIFNFEGLEEAAPSSSCIIDITAIDNTANVMKLVAERIDSYTGANSELERDASRSGVIIIKLDDALKYAEYTTNTTFNTATTQDGAVNATFDVTVSQEAPFSRTGDEVTISTDNLVLAFYTVRTEAAPNAYEEFISYLQLDTVTVPGGVRVHHVPSDQNSSEWGHQSLGCLLNPTSGEVLRLRMITQEGGNGTFSWKANLQLVELPATAKAIIVEATTGSMNSAATFTWDTNPYIDSDVFTHTAGTNSIEADVAGDYLAFSGLAHDTGVVAEMTPVILFNFNGVEVNYMSGTSETLNPAQKDHVATHAGMLYTGVAATNTFGTRTDRYGKTNVVNTDYGAMSVLKLDTLVSGGAQEYTINGSSAITLTPASTMLEGQSISGTSSIALTPASTMLEGRSISGDSSIVFNVASGMVRNQNPSIAGDSDIILTPASTMLEGRVFSGDVSITFNINGQMVEGRGISGSSSIVFTPAANFEVGYTFTGASDITLTPASTMLEGRVLDGDSSIVFNIASGMVANVNPAINGDSSITITPTSVMIEGRVLEGDSSIVFNVASGMAFNQNPSIAGDSDIVLTPASTMVEGRVLDGDSSIVFNIASGMDFTLNASLNGDSSIVFNINGKMVEGRGIFGDSSIVFTPAANFEVGYTFAGSSAITLTPASAMVEGRVFTGASDITVTPASVMIEGRVLNGDSSIVFNIASDMTFNAGNTISGDSAIVFTPTANTAVERTVDGDSTITVTANSAFSLDKAIAGDSSITLTPDSATSVGRDLQGNSAITFDINANFEFVSGNEIVGDSSITLTPEATMVKGLSFIGDSSITLTPDSALGFGNEIEGDSSITVTPASEMRVGRVRIGDSTITLTPNGEFDIARNPAINGDSSIILVPAANIEYIPERGIVGMSTIVITPKTFFPLPSFSIEVDNVETITINVSNVDTQSIKTANNTLPSVLVANNELVSIESIPDIINIKSIDD